MHALERFSKWVQLKIYQIEVTFSVYIFTPREKFIFWSLLFLLVGLTLIATILYLPQHIVFLVNRAWFYINGDSVDVMGLAKGAVHSTLEAARTAARAGSSAAPTVLREL